MDVVLVVVVVVLAVLVMNLKVKLIKSGAVGGDDPTTSTQSHHNSKYKRKDNYDSVNESHSQQSHCRRTTSLLPLCQVDNELLVKRNIKKKLKESYFSNKALPELYSKVVASVVDTLAQSEGIAPEGHVSPETEQVSSPGSASSTHLEEHDEEDYDDDDDDATAIDTQIEASDHEDVPIETVLPANRPANTTYDAIVASEGKIVEAENRRHSDFMTVLERMIALQEETVSQLAHLHRVFIEVPKQLQKINTSFEALVVQQTQANYWRMTNVPQINTSQPGSVHAGQFSPHSSDIHSPGPNVTGQVADIAVQVPDDILPLPSVQIQQQTPTKEPTKTKHKQLLLTSFWSKTTKDTHETDQPSLVQCLPTCSHVSVGTSPVREQSLPKSPVGESLAKSPVGESLPKSPVGESLPKSPVVSIKFAKSELDQQTPCTTKTGANKELHMLFIKLIMKLLD
ncbi:uncharacterized protein LOC142494636 [Ascaphus truei]|uniref:uncharacterized protein LOC142494636 n=1 Tax=Ascaphus truei TaxID=8439 RepID=UPI003F590D4A